MPTIFTIGHTKKTLERFVELLQQAGVDAVVDVRLRNTSQLAGFSKRDDLAFLLREGFGIEYEHRPDLAPSAEIFEAFKSDGDWTAYERAFHSILSDRAAEEAGRELLDRYHRLCLLCTEPEAEHCHRRLVAEWWQEHLSGVKVEHLG
jgi:uncharacterized protein (DUF488 family)